MADIEPMTDDDGEVRELTAKDLATFRRGATWMTGRSRTRRALDDIVKAIEARDLDAAREFARRARAALD